VRTHSAGEKQEGQGQQDGRRSRRRLGGSTERQQLARRRSALALSHRPAASGPPASLLHPPAVPFLSPVPKQHKTLDAPCTLAQSSPSTLFF